MSKKEDQEYDSDYSDLEEEEEEEEEEESKIFRANLYRQIQKDKSKELRRYTYNIFLALILIFVVSNYSSGGECIYSLLAMGCYCIILSNISL